MADQEFNVDAELEKLEAFKKGHFDPPSEPSAVQGNACIHCDGGFPARVREIAEKAAETVAEKNAAYGDSFSKSGEILNILYPAGIPKAAYPDALAITRVIDKLFRLATDKAAFGESPWLDILGYALLALEREKRESE